MSKKINRRDFLKTAAVGSAGFAPRRVNDQVNLLALNLIGNVGSIVLADLKADLARYCVRLQKLEGAVGGLEPETQLREPTGSVQDDRLVLVGDHGAAELQYVQARASSSSLPRL